MGGNFLFGVAAVAVATFVGSRITSAPQARPVFIAIGLVLGLQFPYLITPGFLAPTIPLEEIGSAGNLYHNRKVKVQGRFRTWEPGGFNIGNSNMMVMELYDEKGESRIAFDAGILSRAPDDHAMLLITGVVKSFGGSERQFIGTSFEDLGIPREKPRIEDIAPLRAALQTPLETEELIITKNDVEFLPQLPEEIRQLGALRKLRVVDVDLEELPAWIGNLKGLESIDLSYNELTELPQEIADLPELRSLSLSGNDFGELPSVLFRLKNLRKLHLDGVGLEEISPGLGVMQDLLVLNIRTNRLTSLPDDLFTLQLADIWTSGNRIGDFQYRVRDHNEASKRLRRTLGVRR